MNELETELRHVMRERAAALTSAPPRPIHGAGRRGQGGRGRRRVMVVAVTAVLMLGAAVALAGVRIFRVTPISDRFVIASGETAGGPWQLILYQARIAESSGNTAKAWCLNLDSRSVDDANAPETAANICSLRDAPDEPIGPVALFPGFHDDQALLYGQVSSEVTHLEIALEGGEETMEVAVIPAPQETGLPVGYFATFVATAGEVEIVARDGNGEILERERIGGDSG